MTAGPCRYKHGAPIGALTPTPGCGIPGLAGAFAAVGVLLWAGLAAASPSSALRDYKSGQYERALRQYEQLLEHRSDDPRLHFNAGAAAYRNQQFDEAAKQFDQALVSPDVNLQELAYYNRGNSLYYLGEGNPDPGKKTEAWEKSLKDFESSLKLNPQDADAKFNRDFVKRKLEELKQQQQQQKQQPNKPDQQPNQDQQQQHQQNQQNPDQQQQQNQQQPQQQQQQQQRQQQQEPPPAHPQKQDEKKPPANKQSPEKKEPPQPKASAGQPADKSDEKEQQEAAYAAGQMTPKQAEQLLDAQKSEERLLPPQPKEKPLNRSRFIRDW